MATALKLFFSKSIVHSIARDLAQVHAAFPQRAFVAQCLRGLSGLELLDRAGQIAGAMRGALPERFPESARILVASLGPEHPGTEHFGMAPFRYLPHVLYVQRYGLDHFEEAMQAQHELTRRFSAESSIRPYLVRYPQATLARLHLWASDPNPHVRRLVSEGTRPRLPWAARLPAFQRDPAPVIELLERLKDDPEAYVRRSVANNLNDIARDHPDRVVELCGRWLRGASPERQWIVRHALRSLVKATHPGALRLMGAGSAPRVHLTNLAVSPRKVKLGGTARFSFDLSSTVQAPQALLIDYAVHYIKASGKASPKVFKLKRLTLPGMTAITLGARISFADLTTRKHYAGSHRIELLINGRRTPLGEVRVQA
jgi:3-methyladenine DNA glycosylase AlkC